MWVRPPPGAEPPDAAADYNPPNGPPAGPFRGSATTRCCPKRLPIGPQSAPQRTPPPERWPCGGAPPRTVPPELRGGGRSGCVIMARVVCRTFRGRSCDAFSALCCLIVGCLRPCAFLCLRCRVCGFVDSFEGEKKERGCQCRRHRSDDQERHSPRASGTTL